MFAQRLSELISEHKGQGSFRDIAKRMNNLVSHAAVAKWHKGDVEELEETSYAAISILTGKSPESIKHWLKTGKSLEPETQLQIQKLREKIDKLLAV